MVRLSPKGLLKQALSEELKKTMDDIHSDTSTAMIDREKQEAEQLIKRGLLKNMKSSVSWHVMGLLHKANRELVKARKAFAQAIKMAPNNTKILTDLAHLKIQLREYTLWKDSRRELVKRKGHLPQNWVGYIVALWLDGDKEEAIENFHEYQNILKTSPKELKSYKYSELVCFKSYMLEQMGQYKECAELLKQFQEKIQTPGLLTGYAKEELRTRKPKESLRKLLEVPNIRDIKASMERYGRCLEKLGDNANAAKVY